MKPAQHRVSLGVIALIVCLALPAGLLSLLSSSTTGEQVDVSDVILVGRVAAVQTVHDPLRTIVTFALEEPIFGAPAESPLVLTIEGKLPLSVGDRAVAMLTQAGPALMGTYLIRKDSDSLDYEVIHPITGMSAQGIATGAQQVPLPTFAAAILSRKTGASGGPGPDDDIGGSTGLADDAFEPNNTLATAAPVPVERPHLLTGMPTVITGLTLTDSDVDFYGFDGSALSVLHAQTGAAAEGLVPDTFMGLFDVTSGQLLAYDDDGGDGTFSLLTVPLESTGPYAVAVESAPDTNLDFAGDEGTTTGEYTLSLELENGSYLWNNLDLILGVSADSTFIEDFIGFKSIGKDDDVLLVGVPADGWAIEYGLGAISGATHIYGGAGDHLVDPGFTSPLVPFAFELGPFQDGSGFNRRGFAKSTSIVASQLSPPRGVANVTQYTVSVGARSVAATIGLANVTGDRVEDVTFTRLLDVDLFGTGPDHFFWRFDPASSVKAFPTDLARTVGSTVPPAQTVGDVTQDMQAALTIDAGDFPAGTHGEPQNYPAGFCYVVEKATETAAVDDATRQLTDLGLTTWVIAVDQDPETGLFAAFGCGLGE